MLGKSLGHYEIIEPLGAGGMGEVYRAHDASLNRDVAIKVLPEDLSCDPDRLARLKREAHLLAALNHPNIATIHALEEADTTRFLVMELVKGESLEQRLAAGLLPVDEALDICRQIAEALEAAHEEGIIHRDLKPANVLITPEGRAKVLDFGLAKTVETATSDVDISHSPTLTVAGTQAGVIIGTAPYMSPEQVRGQPLDKRADIWAFGCVLYEILTGSRAFNRETVADTLAAILEVDPPWDALPSDAPAILHSVLRRCLRKDPKRRLRDIGDARIELEEALGEPAREPPSATTTATRAATLRRVLPLGVGIAFGAIAAGLVFWSLTRPTAPVTYYVEVNLQPGIWLWGGHGDEARVGGDRPSRTAFALTPDGRTIVYAATDGTNSRLYRRSLDKLGSAVPITGTEGGSTPFLSPDGQEVGFTVGRDIKVVSIDGGEPRLVLSDAPFGYVAPFGVSWTGESIVFPGADGIFLVSENGGRPERLTEVHRDRGEYQHRLPQLLPGGEALLYTVKRIASGEQIAEVVALPIGGTPIVLESDGADARYSPTGHLIFVRRGVLMAAGFDPGRLRVTSEPLPVVTEVMQATGGMNGSIRTDAAQVSFSSSGSLAYATGGVHPEPSQPLVWIDRNGNVEPFPVSAAYVPYPRICPAGRRVAFVGPEAFSSNIVVFDLATKSTDGLDWPGTQGRPVWSPDGARIAFSSDHHGPVGNLYWIADDLEGEPQRITQSDKHQSMSDWSALDVLAYVQQDDIWVVDPEGQDPRLFTGGAGSQNWPAFSPDGRWIAYASDHTGQWEIYVRPYPGPDPEYQITLGEGGTRPVWSRDSSELFYRTGENDRWSMMAVQVNRGTVVESGTPRELFVRRMVGANWVRSYDVAEDGRFLVGEHWDHPPQPVTRINIVINWFEKLKQLVPTGR